MSDTKNFLQPILQDISFLNAFLIGRVPGVQLPADREEALKAQVPFFKKTVRDLLPAATKFFCAHEIHGSEIKVLSGSEPEQDLVPDVDGLITASSHVALGITFADCAPVWIVDCNHKAAALVHSGKRGTEAGIVPKAIRLLEKNFSSQPKDCIKKCQGRPQPKHDGNRLANRQRLRRLFSKDDVQ